MNRKKKVLAVVAAVLTAGLAVGLIVPGIVIAKREAGKTSVRYEAADAGDRELLAGAVEPEALEAGGYALKAADYRFELYLSENGYASRILDGQGDVAMEQEAPVVIQIKKEAEGNDYLGNNSETELLKANYEKLEVTENTVVATAIVESEAGSQFFVSDQYVACEDGRGFLLDRDIKVMTQGAGDEGFNSFVKFREKDAGTSEAYEYFMPSLVIKDEKNLSNTAIGSDLSLDYVWAKDSHMGLPMVMTRNKETGNTFSLAHVTSDSDTGIDESDGSWIVSKNIWYASLGISNVDGYVSVDVCYPGMEGDINYQTAAPGMVRRSHPVRDDVVHTYRVAFEPGSYENFNDAMVTSYQNAYERMPVPEVEADIAKVYEVTMNLFDEYTYEYAKGKMGMPFAIDLDGEIPATDYVMGFVGQQTSLGFHLIRNGVATGSQEEIEKGRAVIDFWVNESFTKYGFPRIWFGTAANVWAGPDIAPSYIRNMSDGMESILDAYLEEKQAGTEQTMWMKRLVTFADWLVDVQGEDGSYCRAYNQDTGEPYSVDDGKDWTGGNNSACPVRFLVRMYEQTGTEKYLTAAKRAGEYIYNTDYQNGKYYGGTPDGQNKLDKEAGIMAMYAFDALYEQTGDEKWLTASEHAAVQAASFVYTFDFNVWGSETYNIYRDLVGTSGLSVIATGGNSTDTFAAALYYEFFKLYVYTGKEFYYDFAKLLQNNTKQFMCIDGSLPYGADGLVCEAQDIARQFYNYSVDCCLLWCNITMIEPIASMEDTFGVATVEEAKEMGSEKLKSSLEAFGTGGKYR